jgi:hypothetical protein
LKPAGVSSLVNADETPIRLPVLRRPRDDAEKAAYERYLLNCSDYLKRQMIIYEHWPQRRYDVLGYRNEKVFTDMNA